jgi:16S rRNA C967 or C1407 C5-methylase (RsmB/RsmF family)/NOL1/NOP2/fmu family ribosome biogenesis protein
MSEEPEVSVRRNPSKLSMKAFQTIFNEKEGCSVPWCDDGLYLSCRKNFTLDPMLHCGAYYVQDASSMFVGTLFKNTVSGISGRLRILDLCAAPGGKTTHMAAVLHSLGKSDSILVSNEAISSRINSLVENVGRWGEPNVVVTNSDAAAFRKLPGFFDIILVDAPCSGEGMFRKERKAVSDWSEGNVRLCAARQKRILGDIWPALKEGGTLIYSTCTYNRLENDGNLEWMASELGAETIDIGNIPDGAIRTSAGGVQFIPGKIRGEGQFVSAVRKNPYVSISPKRTARLHSGKKNEAGSRIGNIRCGYVTGDMVFSMKGELLKAIPKAIYEDVAAVEASVKTVRSGIAVAMSKGKDLIPEFDLAHINPDFLDKSEFDCVEVGTDEALFYLRKGNPVFKDRPKGYILLIYKGLPLGFVKNLGNRTNNLMPASRRILI